MQEIIGYMKRFIKIAISRLLYKFFKYDTKIIVLKDYYENNEYIISEPICAGCGMYTKKYYEHKPSK